MAAGFVDHAIFWLPDCVYSRLQLSFEK